MSRVSPRARWSLVICLAKKRNSGEPNHGREPVKKKQLTCPVGSAVTGESEGSAETVGEFVPPWRERWYSSLREDVTDCVGLLVDRQASGPSI